MSGWPAETLALALLALCLLAAVRRPFGLSESAIALPAAAFAVAAQLIPTHDATEEVRRLFPTVAFLAAILVFGHLCADLGVFGYLAYLGARASRADPRRLLLVSVALASAITVTLTLDATVVLLTPVVLAAAHRLRTQARPHAMACTQLANAGSLLLPVSNLTNLLVFTGSGLSFGRFTALMALPWLAMTGLQWVQLRWFFRADLPPRNSDGATPDTVEAPLYALAVLVVTLLGFVVASALDVPPAWAALAGVLALAPVSLRRGRSTGRELVGSANLGFCLFVFAIAIVVVAVTRHGLHSLLSDLLPTGSGLLALLAVAAVAAVLANVVNNIPATLALVPLVAGNPAALLAMLLGVNIGPNATYAGSLATLLWRRRVEAKDRPSTAQFHLYGLLTVPLGLVVATVLLWLGVSAVGT